MPTQKDLKRRVRERMRKTGESYTSARVKVLAKRPARPRAAEGSATPAAAPPADLAAIGGMSDAAVAKKTGRTWREWVAELDRSGALALPHPAIARLLRTEHRLPSWWAQMVTVGYERIRGLREPGQRRDGRFDVNKSKTYPVSRLRLWTAFGRCKSWLGEEGVRMSKATKPKSMRMRWADGTPIEVNFFDKGPAKSQVQLQHKNRPTREDAARLRAFWGERLAVLGTVLARSTEKPARARRRAPK